MSWIALLLAEDAEVPSQQSDAAVDSSEDEDSTKKLLEKLTINMAAEVIDERTFALRDSARNARKLIRLGNVALPEQGSLSDEEHKERLEAAKEALKKLVEKQMIFYKPAPDELQTKPEEGDDEVILADVWTIDGRYIAGNLQKDGHLLKSQEYDTELAKDILTAEAEENKRQSYKELQEALKESEKAKAQARKEAEEARREQEEAESIEPIGVAGWIGILVVIIIVVGTLANFGRPTSKKTNLNRKRGPLEKFWMKLKGA